MKRVLLALFVLLSVTFSFAQTQPLSKKETKEFIAQLKELVTIGDFETALKVYQGSVRQIDIKNIAKGDRDWWETTKADLDQKDRSFKSSQAAVEEAKKLYLNQEYWRCNEALNNLSLSRACARLETLRQFNDIKTKIQGKLSVLETVDSKMPEVIDFYNKKDLEQLFLVFFNGMKAKIEQNGESIKGYIDPKYLPSVDSIINEYGSLYNQYATTFIQTVSNPLDRIEAFPKKIKEMGYNEAKDCLAFFQSVVATINKSSDFPADKYPILAGKQNDLLKYSSDVIAAVNDRLITTNPINSYFKGGRVTLQQIKADCSKADSDLKSILSLDVLKYYHKRFSSDLQRELYKESDEYKAYYSELQQMKKQALNTVYYSSLQVNTGNYSVEDGCYFIEIGSNKGVHHLFGDWDVEVHHPNEIEGVVHESLSIARATNRLASMAYRNGNQFYYYHIQLPVSKENALQLERKECELIVCFVPSGMKTYRCMGAEYDGNGAYDIFYADTTCPFSTKVRLLLFSKSGDLLFDKII